MAKLALEIKFKFETYDWKFTRDIEGTTSDPLYRIRLFRNLSASDEELVIENVITGPLAHAFMENDLLFRAYAGAIEKLIRKGELKV